MKTSLPLFLTLAFSSLAFAQKPTAAPGFDLASSAWLTGRGALSVEEIGTLVGARFSPAERARLERVVAARNAGLEKLNAQLSLELSQILGQSDAQIATRIETQTAQSAEAARLERLKRLQPSRYQEMMRRKRAEVRQTSP